MRKCWDDFWFEAIDARQYAVLRIAFGCLSLVYLLELLPYAEAQFSGAGWLGEDTRQVESLNGGSWSLFFLPYSNSTMFVYAVFAVGIATSVFLAFGWRSRLNAAIAWLVWVSLWNRNPLILDGDDALIKLMCFYLMLSPCGNAWSVDAKLKTKAPLVAVWPLRLIQFQIALLYFVSGWVKFYSPEWQDGSILPIILIHPHYSRWDGWSLIHSINNDILSWLSSLIANVIRWWELLFPLLIINSHTRKLCLIFGIIFHLGLLLTMNLRWFAVIMLALYPALLPDKVFAIFETEFSGIMNSMKKWATKYQGRD